ncbi:MAG: four helix bundle protein [Verrucomicrobiales bacterium]|nr:four helix bundle protein [Verrucomicrobiales bacterium]
MTDQPLIAPHGGYRKLKSFQVAQLVYDLTVRFCDRYIAPRSRTHDQMVQAARSGVQNIAEGSEVSATSRKMELKLTQVARACLEELRLDHEDFLRHGGLVQWACSDPRRQALVDRRCATVEAVADWIHEVHRAERGGRGGSSGPCSDGVSSTPSTYPEIAANAALILINVAAALLDRQIGSLAALFEQEGGFTERLHRVRSQNRRRP